MLRPYLAALGVAEARQSEIIERVIELGGSVGEDDRYEAAIHSLLAAATSFEAWKQALDERSARIFEQISPYLLPGATIDYGCGDGGVGRRVSELQGNVTLADTYRHPDIDSLRLPFISLTQAGQALIKAGSFDNVILCTVLHHSDSPLQTLSEAVRIAGPGGRVLIIESVYGVPESLALSSPQSEQASAFGILSRRQQFAANAFFDHFYNRCLHYSSDPRTKVNVPYNYQTPHEWQTTFENNDLLPIALVPLGLDQPLCPLFHTLHVTSRA
jgi:SAM-dependent methyltransferase